MSAVSELHTRGEGNNDQFVQLVNPWAFNSFLTLNVKIYSELTHCHKKCPRRGWVITFGFAPTDTKRKRFRFFRGFDLKSDCASHTRVMFLVYETVGGGRPRLLPERRDPWRLGLTLPIPDEVELSLPLSLGTGAGQVLTLSR